jgi:anti-sigma regulatory factor (Ser/Thr protein kinase)
MATWQHSCSVDLPTTTKGVAFARSYARSALENHDPQVVDVVVLLTSEVVTNALLHGESASRLQIERSGDSVRVTVDDQSADSPQVRHPPPADEQGGRGMLLVDALASSWGWEPRPGGKRVWFIV